MRNESGQSIRINDPETGSALALLLSAAGYEVETNFVDGSAVILAQSEDAELPLLGERPQLASFDLACQLHERLDRAIDEDEFAELSNELHGVA